MILWSGLVGGQEIFEEQMSFRISKRQASIKNQKVEPLLLIFRAFYLTVWMLAIELLDHLIENKLMRRPIQIVMLSIWFGLVGHRFRLGAQSIGMMMSMRDFALAYELQYNLPFALLTYSLNMYGEPILVCLLPTIALFATFADLKDFKK